MMDENLISSLIAIQEKSHGILSKYKDLISADVKQNRNSYNDISELINDINVQKESINFNAWLHEAIVTSFFEN